MVRYLTNVVEGSTPQSEPMLGENQVANNAGGYVYKVDDFTRLERFLVLGSEGGTYYVQERSLTQDNAQAVKRAIESDGIRAVETIVRFSQDNRIPKNSTALFALAMAASYGDSVTREEACKAIPEVARTGSFLFEFVRYVDSMRSWGRRLRRGVGDWYSHKDVASIAYDMVKYRNRYGWTHRDILRSTHTRPSPVLADLFRYALKGDVIPEIPIVQAFEEAQTASTERLVELIRERNMSWEMVPSTKLSESKVWDVLAERMPMTALFRNLATLTRVGVIAPLGDRTAEIASRLTNQDNLNRERIHPLQAVAALRTYASGKSVRGDSTWIPVPQIVTALDEAVEKAFNSVEPTNKRFYVGVDVSGSMWSGEVSSIPGLTPALGAAIMASVITRIEPAYYVAGFAGEMRELGITSKDTIESAQQKTKGIRFGRTDCALPMLDALDKKMPVDCFIVITDNETWAGNMHPKEALDKYRREMGIPAKLVVIGMTSTEFSIADPNDAGMLDIVGFDTNVPTVIANFVS